MQQLKSKYTNKEKTVYPWDSDSLSHGYEKKWCNEQVTLPSGFCVDTDVLSKFCHYSLC